MAKKHYHPLKQFSLKVMKEESKKDNSNLSLFEWAILITLGIYILIK